MEAKEARRLTDIANDELTVGLAKIQIPKIFDRIANAIKDGRYSINIDSDECNSTAVRDLIQLHYTVKRNSGNGWHESTVTISW